MRQGQIETKLMHLSVGEFSGTTIPDIDFRDVCPRIPVVILQWRIPTNQQNLFGEKNGQEHHHNTMSYDIRSWSLQPSPVRGWRDE